MSHLTTTPTPLSTIVLTGFADASHYDKYRPSYPSDAVDALLTHLCLKGEKGARVIDVGCGTGKFTDVLIASGEGFEILGVEPHGGMREELVRKLGLGGDKKGRVRDEVKGRVRIVDGDAAHMPVEDDWADAAIASQSFHWFANKESLKEIHRALKPGARFGMVWNVDDYNSPRDWPATTHLDQKLKDQIIASEDSIPRFRHMKWKEVFTAQQESGPLQALKDTFTHNFPSFSLPLGEEKFPWTAWLSPDDVWARLSTLSQVVNSSEEKREEMHEAVVKAVEECKERNDKGEVPLHGCTYLAWTSRV